MTSVWTPAVLERLAGSLLHFVWQGAAIALAAAVVLRVLKNRPPEWRYAAALSALLAMFLAPFLTFAFYAETGVFTLRLLRGLDAATTAASEVSTAEVAVWTTRIVFVWMIGVAVFLMRLAGGWFLSRRLMRSASAVVAPVITETLDRARAGLGFHGKVRLLSGERIETPIVMGWLRPAILLPASALTGLSADQLLAILAHELAHVRRHDFLVNGIQRGVECVLFYHPAVWWISGRIRVERERCCDDLAVLVCGDKLVYAQALVALEKARAGTPLLALPTAGAGVADRVRRILGIRRANRDWQSAAAAAVFAAILFGAGLWQPATLAGPAVPLTAPIPLQPLPAPSTLPPESPVPATPLRALLAIATAETTRSLAEAQAPPAPPQVTQPSVATSREAARREFGQLNLDFSVETLIKQAGEGDTIAVKLLLETGMNPNAIAVYNFGLGVSTKDGVVVADTELDTTTALISAAAKGQAETIQLLLAAKADPNRTTQRTGHTALMYAAQRGLLEAVKVLLAGGANVNQVSKDMTALRLAAKNGHADVLQVLLDRGADPKDPANMNALRDAVCGRHDEPVRILLEHGAPILGEPVQDSALHCAAQSGNEPVLTLLLDKGTNINVRDGQGRTPLMIAASAGQLGTTRQLLDRNPDLDTMSTESHTALTLALVRVINSRDSANRRQLEERTGIFNLLLARGANPNAGWISNETALIVAARNGSVDIVKALIEKGADVNAKAKNNSFTPLPVARDPEVRQLLINAGAK